MKVTFENGFFITINWHHFNKDRKIKDDVKEKIKNSQYKDEKEGTLCIIKDHNGNVMATGKANKHKDDTFNKEKGRRISLERILYKKEAGNYVGNHYAFSTEDRKLIWESYNKLFLKQ